MTVTIVGIDCATIPKKVGLALACWRNGEVEIQATTTGSSVESIAETVSRWIPEDRPTLISIDAPLGWPVALGRTLAHHIAGEPVDVDPDMLFRRATDHKVKQILKRQSLDVGADRIALTAHAALQILGELRQLTGQSIPLAWNPEIESISVIEVYPAATLTAYGIQASGYKKSSQVDRRASIVESLRGHLALPSDVSLMLSNADVLDAVVCVLAAKDFLLGRVVEPENRELAKKEGWIWFRPK